jgi:dTDP-4-amino-4,6-dideoxygalactose transaminase
MKTKNKKLFKPYVSIGNAEKLAAIKVLKSGKLSGFVADKSEGFLGGSEVKKFETHLQKFYKVKHAISVNSWTSGLMAMVGALDINPGDEIIVSPWTMSATVASIIQWNAIPVFADIDPQSFCLDPKDVKLKISNNTKAILTVDIFGRSSNINELKKIIKNKNIKILTDSAQAPYCLENNKIAGTYADAGGYSLNYHKIIHTGEGGIIVTNNDRIAKRARLLRNHAEVTNTYSSKKDLSNMVGFNFRMGEIEAAIGLSQYKKLKKILTKREKILNMLTTNLENLKGLILPPIGKSFFNNYYVYPMVIDQKKLKFSRSKIINLLQKEGVKGISGGYQNVHLLPMLKKKIAFGTKNFPWSFNKKKFVYKKGLCPVAEKLHNKTFFKIEVCMFDLGIRDIEFITKAFFNVWKKLKIH